MFLQSFEYDNGSFNHGISPSTFKRYFKSYSSCYILHYVLKERVYWELSLASLLINKNGSIYIYLHRLVTTLVHYCVRQIFFWNFVCSLFLLGQVELTSSLWDQNENKIFLLILRYHFHVFCFFYFLTLNLYTVIC